MTTEEDPKKRMAEKRRLQKEAEHDWEDGEPTIKETSKELEERARQKKEKP